MEELVRVVFYFVDDFCNEHILRKSYIGNVTRQQYEESIKGNFAVCFEVGSDYYAEHFPETITK